MTDTGPYSVETLSALSQVSAADWNALANPAGQSFDPFISWEFLASLEDSASATQETGWRPCHMWMTDRTGTPVAAAPLYLKSHSYGEYIFDHAWADAFQRAGGQYYPKLLNAVPFTPVPGRRLLAGDETAMRAGAQALVQLCKAMSVSSLHLNFVTPRQLEPLRLDGLLHRTDQQFHWFNQGYRSFDDFLNTLTSRKRKDLRKERRKAREGLCIHHLRGDDIKPKHWDAFYRVYQDTGERKWGSPYLTRGFFERVHQRLGERILLIMAFQDNSPIAAALNFIGTEALYGRHWGRLVDIPFLHFELCYYQAIDAAIALGLSRVEAGAQGGHKLARGYEPVTTHSLHWIAHSGFRDAVSRYLDQERQAVAQDMVYASQALPYRKGPKAP